MCVMVYNRWFQEPAVKRNWAVVVGTWFLVLLGIGGSGLPAATERPPELDA